MNHTKNDYSDMIVDLRQSLTNRYLAVSKGRNPVYCNHRTYDDGQLIDALRQYTCFPNMIVTMLTAARDTCRAVDWTPVAVELTRNLGEELGTETHGVTHYRMLVDGLETGLGIPFRDTEPSNATHQFIGTMIKEMHALPSRVVGAVYALESSAVPELEIVLDLTNQAFVRRTRSSIPDGQLQRFFDDHLHGWEPAHEEGIVRTAEPYVQTPQARQSFTYGFDQVMQAMDAWWTGLHNELTNPNRSTPR